MCNIPLSKWVIVVYHQLSNFSAILWPEQVNFQWDDDEVCFVLDTLSWFSGEATNTNFLVFGLTWSGFEPTIYRIQGKHASHFTTNVVSHTHISSLYTHILMIYYMLVHVFYNYSTSLSVMWCFIEHFKAILTKAIESCTIWQNMALFNTQLF